MANMKSATQSPKARQQIAPLDDAIAMRHDLVEYLREYAREKPEVAALWCFGIGFILGWKLKFW